MALDPSTAVAASDEAEAIVMADDCTSAAAVLSLWLAVASAPPFGRSAAVAGSATDAAVVYTAVSVSDAAPASVTPATRVSIALGDSDAAPLSVMLTLYVVLPAVTVASGESPALAASVALTLYVWLVGASQKLAART